MSTDVENTKDGVLKLSTVVGRGYRDFWNSRKRYVVVKGSRGSKKSKTSALWHIFMMMKYPDANTLVVRKVAKTLRDSCYSDLLWAIQRLGAAAYWRCTTSPLEMTYLPTGGKILFRGLDDPFKVTSISVAKGSLCFFWIEEAYEIMKEQDFDTLNESLRGVVPEGLFKRITISFNPWSERSWLKARFFDKPNEHTLALTTTYKCNEWLDDADIATFEDMKERNPRRYRVAGLGEWGIAEGLVYENFEERKFDPQELGKVIGVFGLDFGYTNDPTAFFVGSYDKAHATLYVYDEIYKTRMLNKDIYQAIEDLGYRKERIVADSAEPKSIDELKGLGLSRIRGARKGKDSIRNGIAFIQGLKLVVHPRCVNFLTEVSTYTWKVDRHGKTLNEPVDDMNHLLDAMRYAMEEHISNKEWKY